MKLRLRCKYCGHEFEVTEDDVDADVIVEELKKGSTTVSLSIKVICPKCNRRVIHGVESIDIEYKVEGEIL